MGEAGAARQDQPARSTFQGSSASYVDADRKL